MQILILLALLGLSQASFLFPYTTPPNVIKNVIALEVPANISTSFCSDAILNYCQAQFNSRIGVDQSLSFRNGTYLFDTVQSQLDMNQTQYDATCSTYKSFAQCLGYYRDKCTNMYTLFHKPQADQQNVFDYVRTMRGLDYMCNSGADESTGMYACIQSVPASAAYQQCTNTFTSTVNVGNLCPDVDQSAQCLKKVYADSCGTNHYGCSNFALTFMNACWGVKC